MRIREYDDVRIENGLEGKCIIVSLINEFTLSFTVSSLHCLICHSKESNYLFFFSSSFLRNKLNVKQAINYIAQAWNDVSIIMIRNCWHATRILPDATELSNVDLDKDNLDNDVSDRC